MNSYTRWLAQQQASEARKNERQTNQWLTLESWVREFGWTHGAEIGVCRGWTLFHLLDAFPDLKMIGVDQWKEEPLTGEPGQDDYSRINLPFCSRMVKDRAVGYGDRCTILHCDSVSAARAVTDGSLDFVFIDGDHTARGVKADIRAWAPKVRGFITGHDWHRPEVRRVLDEELPGWTEHDNHCWRVAV